MSSKRTLLQTACEPPCWRSPYRPFERTSQRPKQRRRRTTSREFELTDAEGIRPYSAAVESTFAPFGGRYAARGGKVVSLEGEPSKRVIMIVFPSLEQAQAWYDSPRYREIMPTRRR